VDDKAVCESLWCHPSHLHPASASNHDLLDLVEGNFKTGGENVASVEVEEAIAGHPSVAEVAVIGLHDPYWIEKVVAVVTLLPGAETTPDELTAFARERLAGFKVPKQIFIVDELPKNPTGKVLKRELRKSFEHATETAS